MIRQAQNAVRRFLPRGGGPGGVLGGGRGWRWRRSPSSADLGSSGIFRVQPTSSAS
jgi:hypothetical protein